MNQQTTLRRDAYDISNLLAHAFWMNRLDLLVHDIRCVARYIRTTHFRGLSTTTDLFPAALAGTQLVEDIRFEERIALKEIAQDRAQEELEDVDATGVEQISDLRTSPSVWRVLHVPEPMMLTDCASCFCVSYVSLV